MPKTDWCLVARDRSRAICARVESSRRFGSAGWLHDLGAPPVVHMRPAEVRQEIARLRTAHEWNTLQDKLTSFVDLESASRAMNVGSLGLERLGCGWCARYGGHTFPMRDADRAVVGIRVRRADAKFCYPGSRNGLFIPATIGGPQLIVCEGPTDCAALLDCGLDAIGRPNNTGGHDDLVRFARRGNWRDIVIIADRDNGTAERLTMDAARRLGLELCKHGATIRLLRPPDTKDARDWITAGNGRREVMNVIECGEYL